MTTTNNNTSLDEYFEGIRELLLMATDSQLDASMKPRIQGWTSPPNALEVLEVLDYCVNGSLSSGFIIRVLEVILKQAIEREKTTYDNVVSRATWRSTL